VIRVGSFDVAAKRLQFLTNQFANLVQLGLQLYEARIVDHVLLHLLVFPRPHALQASERHPPNSQRLFARLLPSQMLIGMRGICRLALSAKLAVVIAARRSADCHHFATVTQTSVVPLSLHHYNTRLQQSYHQPYGSVYSYIVYLTCIIIGVFWTFGRGPIRLAIRDHYLPRE
jgi:hypothetical protein